MIDEFQGDEAGAKASNMTIQSGGVGLNMTRASRVYFLEMERAPGLMIQAEARAHRERERGGWSMVTT